jgi:sporulation protein YlmC with PRC-barrel domain
MSDKNKRLQELRGSNYEVAKGQPDIRGWEVRDKSGHLIGKVNELIFDSRAHKVRYMVVNVIDSKELQLEKRTVMVPIGLALLQPKDDDVILETVTSFQLRALPKYYKDDLGTRAEKSISTVFGRTDQKAGAATPDDADLNADFYEHEHFNEQNMYRNRPDNTKAQSIARAENENASIRREEDLNMHSTGSSTHIDDLTMNERLGEIDEKRETDEEYTRRTGRHRK